MRSRVITGLAPAIIAGAALAFAIRFGTYAPWGTDAAGYVGAAARWSIGRLAAPSPLTLGPAWARDGAVATPVAYRPGIEKGTDVSIYPPGLPLMMALALRLGGDMAAYLVVPLCVAILVWSTFWVAAAIAGRWSGFLAASTIAISPVALLSAIQPMSDVPSAALWMLAWAMSLRPGIGASAAAGASVAMAIVVRPNLAPLGLVLAALQLFGPGVSATTARSRRLAVFMAAAAVGPGVIAWSQAVLYGGPTEPGYPGWQAFYRLSHVWPNLLTYPRMIASVHSPLVYVGLIVAPFLWPIVGRGARSPEDVVAWSAIGMASLSFGVYLPYLPYDDLEFLRFFIPSLAAVFVLLAATVTEIARRLFVRSRWLVGVAMIPVVVTVSSGWPLIDYVRRVADGHRRIVLMGRYLEHALPANAAVLSFLHSAAVTHYTGAAVVRYDLISADMFDQVVDDLTRLGYRPVLVLDENLESPAFAAKFARSAIGRLDWPPKARARDAVASIAYYDLSDRARPAAGQPLDVIIE
jgi:hypothetical protein